MDLLGRRVNGIQVMSPLPVTRERTKICFEYCTKGTRGCPAFPRWRYAHIDPESQQWSFERYAQLVEWLRLPGVAASVRPIPPLRL